MKVPGPPGWQCGLWEEDCHMFSWMEEEAICHLRIF